LGPISKFTQKPNTTFFDHLSFTKIAEQTTTAGQHRTIDIHHQDARSENNVQKNRASCMVAGFTTWRTQLFRPTDDTPSEPIKQPRQENHQHAVTTAKMAEEQSKNHDSIEEHTRNEEIINPPKRARTDDHDTTQVGVSEGSVTHVGPGLINNGLIATLTNEADMFSSSEEEDAEMDDGSVIEGRKPIDGMGATDTITTPDIVVNAKTGMPWAVPRHLDTALNPTQDLQSRRQAIVQEGNRIWFQTCGTPGSARCADPSTRGV
jgi:hypothetical protein